MNVQLADLAATRRFGAALGAALGHAAPGAVPVFFHGGLGMGKTTLISALVRSLPGGDAAETSSPSFTLCNLYATTPPVAHFDLYRQEDGCADETLLDTLEEGRFLVLVEWAERLPCRALPPDRIECSLATAEAGNRRDGDDGENSARRIHCEAFGEGRAVLEALRLLFPEAWHAAIK